MLFRKVVILSKTKDLAEFPVSPSAGSFTMFRMTRNV